MTGLSAAMSYALKSFPNAKKNGAGYKDLCPCHDDHTPSLYISDGEKGVVLTCHVCRAAFADIVKAKGLEAARLFHNYRPPSSDRFEAIETYTYKDADGNPYMQVVRGTKNGRREFLQKRWTGSAWEWGLKGRDPILYRLHKVQATARAGGEVFVPEGEKDVRAAVRLGVEATTSPMGAGKWRPSYADALSGAGAVYIIPDNDEPGRAHAQDVARSVSGRVGSVKIVDLPGLPPKGDLSDWIAAGGTLEQLRALADAAPEWEPSALFNQTENAASTASPSAVLLRLSDVEPEAITWVWPRRIAAGKITVLDGDPGLGKSMVTLDLAARVSRGSDMPDGTPGLPQPADVLLLSAEDGLADTIRPRLDAAGAVCARVHALEGIRACYETRDGGMQECVVEPDLSAHAALEEAITRTGAALVIVDPIMAYLPVKTDSHRDQDVRQVLRGLAAVAQRTGAAIILVRHLNKAPGGSPLYRGGGSIGIIGAARAGMIVAADPEDETRRILAPTKSNLGPPPPALSYHIEGGTFGVPVVVWGEATNHTAGELLAIARPEESGARDEAALFLQECLAEGFKPSKEVLAAAKRAGIAEKTLHRAKKSLGVVSRKEGMIGGWVWELPPADGPSPEPEPEPTPKMANPAEDSHPQSVAMFGDEWPSSEQADPELARMFPEVFAKDGFTSAYEVGA